MRDGSDGLHFAIDDREYVVPRDRNRDAIVHTDQRQAFCIAERGYSDVLVRYLSAGSTHEVARELQIDEATAHARIHAALIRLQRAYYTEHR